MTATLRTTAAVAQYRDASIDAAHIDVDARTVELAFASEYPVRRWYGNEILDLQAASVRLGRLAGGKHPLLVDHSTRDHVGVVIRAWLGEDRIARALVRFGRSARAEEIFQDVIDGIRSLVSVGYFVHRMVLDSRDDDSETYRITDWEPFEVSIVAVPADPNVGIGREADEVVSALRSLLTIAKDECTMNTHRLQNQAGTEGGAGGSVVTPATTPSPEPAAPRVDLADERSRATSAERTRVREISALGARFNMRELAERAVEEGTTYDAFRETLFGRLAESGTLRLADPAPIGLSQREARRFRFTNLIAAVMFPGDATVQRMAGFELDVARAAADKRDSVTPDRQGAMCIPVDVMTQPLDIGADDAQRAAELLIARAARRGLVGQRDLNVTTTTAGGHLVATDLLASSFIDLLTNAAVVMSLGTTVLTDLVGNVAIPRQTGGSTGYWVAENTAITAESQAAFDQVALTPKTCGAYTDYSRRLLLQSSIAVEAFVRMDIARTIALMIDLAAINGSGSSNQPRGVLNTVGIGSVAGGTNGLAPTWDHIVDLETQVANANAAIGSLAYLTNTKVRGKLKRTQVFASTNGEAIWKGNEVNGYRAAVSNQVPSNLTKGTSSGICSAIAYGNWADLVVAMWGGLDIMLDPYAGATAGTKRVVALQDVDVSVRNAVSFAAMLDALTT